MVFKNKPKSYVFSKTNPVTPLCFYRTIMRRYQHIIWEIFSEFYCWEIYFIICWIWCSCEKFEKNQLFCCTIEAFWNECWLFPFRKTKYLYSDDFLLHLFSVDVLWNSDAVTNKEEKMLKNGSYSNFDPPSRTVYYSWRIFKLILMSTM